MPWSLRKSGDVAGGLRSTIQPLPFDDQSEPDLANNSLNPRDHEAFGSSKSPSPLRNSFEPPVDGNPVSQEQLPKRQRFSMLRYRHASDPQVRLRLLLQIFAILVS